MSEAKLGEYDFYVVVDCSSSMGEPNKASEPTGPTRWQAMQEMVMGFARDISKLDSDGILVAELGGQGRVYHGVNEQNVREMFATLSPRGSTPLHNALANVFNAAKGSKKDFIAVFTDGVPDDKAAAAKAIVDATKGMETDDELTVLFIQIGDDKYATQWLRELDDSLKGAKFDIVDAMTVDEANKFGSTVEMVMKAIND